MINLSICMIVRNELDCLGRCLDSLVGLYDELIIVDTGSDDGTQDLIRQRGAILKEMVWENDFSKARNESISDAKGRWILVLDADEFIPPSEVGKIRRIIEGDADQAFSFQVCELEPDGSVGEGHSRIMLYPNHRGIQYEGAIHEQLYPSLERLGIPFQATDIVTVHTGYGDPELNRKKQRRNQEIIRGEIERNGGIVKPSHRFYLAGIHQDFEEYEEAIDHLIQAEGDLLEASSLPALLLEVQIKLGECLLKLGDFDRVADLVVRMEKWRPFHPKTLLLKGVLNEKRGDLEEAMISYACLYVLPVIGDLFRSGERGRQWVRAAKSLGHYWGKRGEIELAREIMMLGMDLHRGRRNDPLQLIDILRSFDKWDLVEEMLRFQQIMKISGG
ncbi:glycosyltransferase [Magnetococcales bacterium HHB-1]